MKTKIIKKTYYDCGIDKCRHKSKRVALNCIEKNKNSRQPKDIIKYKFDRLMLKIESTEKVINGMTLRDVGEEIGVSGSRISDYVNLIMRMIRNPRHNILKPDSVLNNYAGLSFYRDNKMQVNKALSIFKKLKTDMYHSNIAKNER